MFDRYDQKEQDTDKYHTEVKAMYLEDITYDCSSTWRYPHLG